MGVQTAALSKLFIGTALVVNFDLADATVAAAVEADTLTEAGEVEDMGEFGDQAGVQNFTSIGDRRTRKFKTTFDAGTLQLTLGFDSADDGQAALVAALDSDLDYNFKVQLNDAPGAASGDTPTLFYFRGKVTSNQRRVGSVDNVVRRVVGIAINSRVVEIPAAGA